MMWNRKEMSLGKMNDITTNSAINILAIFILSLLSQCQSIKNCTSISNVSLYSHDIYGFLLSFSSAHSFNARNVKFFTFHLILSFCLSFSEPTENLILGVTYNLCIFFILVTRTRVEFELSSQLAMRSDATSSWTGVCCRRDVHAERFMSEADILQDQETEHIHLND